MNSPLGRSFLAGFAGLIVYGGWAVYANASHGDTVALRAGVVQGSYSLLLTFVMTLATEGLYRALSLVYGGLYWLMMIVCLSLFTTAYGIHYLVGTPEILMTILPGFVIGSIYTLVYVLGLKRHVQ